MSATARIGNQMRLQAALAAGVVSRPRLGLVSSYNPDLYAVKVRLQPEDVETGWLPIETALAGQGWGIYAGPAIGDQATVLFQEGSLEAGWCAGFLPSDEDRPPTVPSGEIHLVHKSECFLKFLNDGKIVSKGAWEHDGTFEATGDITDHTVDNSATVRDLRTTYNTHDHPGDSGGSTGPTNQTVT